MNATLVYRIEAKYIQTAAALAKFAAIDLTPDLEGLWYAARVEDFVTICDDNTVENPPASGTIERTVKLHYSAMFEQAFPTAEEKEYQLRQFGLNLLRSNMRCDVILASADYEANNCP